MSTACPSCAEGTFACIKQSWSLRILLLALSVVMVIGLQGCAALTVMALTEVLDAANEAQRAQSESSSPTAPSAPDQASAQSNQGRSTASMAANQVPREPRYRTRLERDTIEAGTPVRLYSSTSLESLSAQVLALALGVEETLVVFDPKGREIRRGSKKAGAGVGEGKFINSFELLLPSDAPAGSYRLVTEAYLDTQLVGRNELKLKLTNPSSRRQRAQAP